ncbi:hypothetical protein NQ317_004132 [Molorchus minor]|uniref:Uncharacterized protein n=1 Tax=Molorchus minor TaxID=1323400 RepID=A0ABQ9J6R2_9CUCU|nr:hypothetical protein NQ317_004132 [Molorchus minor]
MKLSEYIVLVKSDGDFINYLTEKAVFLEVLECPKCRNNIKLNKERLQFRCIKLVSIGKKKKTRCNYILSARKKTFFECKLSVQQIGLFVGYFLYMPQPRSTFLMEELDFSSKTVEDWSNFCREVCIEWCLQNTQKTRGSR